MLQEKGTNGSFAVDAPKRDVFFLTIGFHTPSTIEATQYKVHGHKQAYLKAGNELAGTQSITDANAGIDGKENDVEAIGEYANVLEFAQVAFFFGQGIDLRAEFGLDASGRRGIGQKAGIPVAEVAGMKQAFALNLDNPAHAAVVAAGGPHFQVFVLPTCTFGQPHVGLSCLCPAVFQHILRKQVGDTGHLLAPGKNARGKVVLVKMTDEDVDGLRLVGAEYARNDIRGVEPIVENEQAGCGFDQKTAVEDVGDLQGGIQN